jgi:transposase
MKTCLSIILYPAEGLRPVAVAQASHVARSTVYRFAKRNREGGLADRREDNGGPLANSINFRVVDRRHPRR